MNFLFDENFPKSTRVDERIDSRWLIVIVEIRH